MEHNDLLRVVDSNSKFPGRLGYFQFYGEGPSDGTIVLSDSPTKETGGSGNYFAVDDTDVEKVEKLEVRRGNIL